MPDQILSDPDTIPTDELISTHLGKAKPLWPVFLSHLKECYPAACADWRYYRDGKSWLMKVTKKSKTLCWVSLTEGAFRVTGYFSDKAEEAIAASGLPAELKQQFKEGKRYGKIRALTIHVRRKADLAAAQVLLELRDQAR